MKILSVLIITLISSFVFASSNAGEYKAMFRFNHGQGFQNDQLGSKVIRDQVRDLKVTYDFKVSGGAVGAINLPIASTPGSSADPVPYLPKNAIVIGCYIDVLTSLSTGSSPTVAIGTGQAANDLKAATASSSFTAGSIVACIPTGTAANSIKLTADSQPSITIATAALTAGKFNVHIMYALSD